MAEKINDWTIVGYAGKGYYECICKCGNKSIIKKSDLLAGRSRRCRECADRESVALRPQNGRKEDLTGRRFDKLYVKEYIGDKKYRCICDCGNEHITTGHNLRTGKCTRCRRCANGFDDITGQKFGEWTAVRFTENKKWLCRCSCGTEREIAGADLRQGRTKSCGHSTSAFKDLTGKRFGKLYVEKYLGERRYLCKCDCGNSHISQGYELRQGIATECSSCRAKRASVTRKANMIDKYGDWASCNVLLPRSDEQLAAIESKDALEDFLIRNELIGKTAKKISAVLGINSNNVLRYIHKFGLEQLISIDGKSSKEEDELYEFIKNECKCSDAIQHDRNVLEPNELDILIPDKKIAIEYDGTYWHCSENKGRTYHQDKTIQCTKKGIRLIHIFEYEWMGDKRDKIEAYLKNIFDDNKQVIYGRNINVRVVDKKSTEEFLNKYHLQGYSPSEVNIGAEYQGELIGVMTFSTPRFNKNYQWELVRFSWKNGIAVIGGAEKLFKFFTSHYDPDNIICYSDISKFRGNVYVRLGFKTNVSQITQPGYVWVGSNNKVVSRYSTQKDKLVANGLGSEQETEDQIMYRQGYLKVYNCGNLRLTWEKQWYL